jgi:hypothetical protein
MAKKELIAALGPPTTLKSFRFFSKHRHGVTAAIEAVQKLLLQFNLWRSQLVIRPESLPSSSNQTRLAQIRQVLGNGRLRQIKDIHQIANAQVASPKQVQDSQAGWVCKCSKDGWNDRPLGLRSYIHIGEYMEMDDNRQCGASSMASSGISIAQPLHPLSQLLPAPLRIPARRVQALVA